MTLDPELLLLAASELSGRSVQVVRAQAIPPESEDLSPERLLERLQTHVGIPAWIALRAVEEGWVDLPVLATRARAGHRRRGRGSDAYERRRDDFGAALRSLRVQLGESARSFVARLGGEEVSMRSLGPRVEAWRLQALAASLQRPLWQLWHHARAFPVAGPAGKSSATELTEEALRRGGGAATTREIGQLWGHLLSPQQVWAACSRLVECRRISRIGRGRYQLIPLIPLRPEPPEGPAASSSAAATLRILMVGGEPRERHRQRLQAATGVAELKWAPATRGGGTGKLHSTAKSIRRGSWDGVVLLPRFCGHDVDAVLVPACKASRTPWLHLRGGYGVGPLREAVRHLAGVCSALSEGQPPPR